MKNVCRISVKWSMTTSKHVCLSNCATKGSYSETMIGCSEVNDVYLETVDFYVLEYVCEYFTLSYTPVLRYCTQKMK